MRFKRPKDVEYQPLKQKQNDPLPPEPASIEETERISEEELEKSRAESIVEEFEKTITFSDWLISLVDDKIKNIVVQVDPEQHPEVVNAMQRIFGNTANRNLSGRSYTEVLEAIRDVNRLEFEEAQSESIGVEEEFINSFPRADETQDTVASEMEIPDEDDIALKEAVEEKVLTGDKEEEKAKLPKWFSGVFRRARLILFRGGVRADQSATDSGIISRKRYDEIVKGD